MSPRITVILPVILCVSASLASQRAADLDDWSPIERALIDSLSIHNLGSPPADPSNRFADNPKAAEFGEKVFHDPRFSANGEVSCSNCHLSDYDFSNALPLSRGIGETKRRSMPIASSAYQKWFFWDGRKDSSWAQALEPLENPNEHGITRTRVAQLVYQHYRKDYESAISQLPELDPFAYPATAKPEPGGEYARLQWQSIPEQQRDRITLVYVNTGKALAAFVRSLKISPNALDRYAAALASGNKNELSSLAPQQKRGLRLFISKAKCINCHNGPMLTNGEFHHAGVTDRGAIDQGRAAVIDALADDEFNCTGRWSDAVPANDCAHLRFLDTRVSRYRQSFKTPSLRNVAIRPPYMHAGQFNTLAAVLGNYRNVSGEGLTDEIFHIGLSDEELLQLEAFLEALTSQ